jgi:hypothetical protein
MAVLAMLDHRLSRRDAWLLCFVAIGLHILPLVLADLAYIDDVWRSQLAGRLQDPGDSWTGQGRVLADMLYGGLGFDKATPNIYPLPLLLAMVVAAKALSDLAFHYFEAPTGTALLVVLPLWFNPFFLQNLSYQYDGAAMALALAASVMAITQGARHRWGTGLAMVLVAAAASLYQVSVNVFAGLCCIEVIRQVAAHAPLRQVVRQLARRLVQLLGGGLLYLLTGYRLIDVPRTALLPLDHAWPETLARRLLLAFEHVGLLVTTGTAWLFLILAGLAGATLVLRSWQVLRSARPVIARVALLALLWCSLVVLMLLVPGISLLFDYYNQGARLLMGVGPAMVLVLLLAHERLAGLHGRLAWFTVIPLVFMLSFSYAYGRLLVAQKEMERVMTSSIAQAIQANPAVYDAKRFYILGHDSRQVWLPAGSGSFQAMPALRYVFAIAYQVLPEMMPRVGMTSFGSHPPLQRAQVLASTPQPQVDWKFFAIHRVDDVGYVLMKPITDAEAFHK